MHELSLGTWFIHIATLFEWVVAIIIIDYISAAIAEGLKEREKIKEEIRIKQEKEASEKQEKEKKEADKIAKESKKEVSK